MNEQEIQQLRAQELNLEDGLVAARAELAAARDRATEAVLTRHKDLHLTDAAGATEHIAAITRAIGAVRRSRVNAIRAAWQAEADAIRGQLRDLHEEETAHAAKTAKLLAQVEAHEGTTFVPEAEVHRASFGGFGAGVLPVNQLASYTIPRSEVLRNRVRALETQAAQIEARRVPDAGVVNASAPAEVLAAVRAWSAWELCPPLHAVAGWLEDQEAGSQQRRERLELRHPGPVTLRIALAWRNGEIAPQESRYELAVPTVTPYVAPGIRVA